MGGERIRENGGGMNLIKIYCKHRCKYYRGTPPAQLIYANKHLKI
jgi:hypothetical protein